MKSWALILCAALLTACAGAPLGIQSPPSQVFHDQLFQPPSAPIDTDSVFALSPRMRDYLRREINLTQSKDVRRQLFDALYRKDKLQLEYDSAMTRNAAQTFDARAGNCLSLVIMTAALARELNLVVQFQLIDMEESWSRSGNLYFAANHVNLALGKPRTSRNPYDSGYNLDMSNSLTVDFIPIPPKARETARPLEEHTIVAMYLNNRAAEQLSAGHVDDAYWSARKAAEVDPRFLNAYNTLGVIYLHAGHSDAAEQVLRYAVSQSPLRTVFLSNLAQSLENQNKLDEAAALRVRLAQLEPHPPFYFFNLGQEAMKLGDYERARKLFEREVERVPDYHEFHFWLALAYNELGNVRAADRHMAQAMANSTTRGDHDLYAAKLDRLRAYAAQAPAK
ncbi:tetratricopeptide repeat protein [Duganella aceris]|uniref:Tetratricopeptide repeat protein n=1 Tax=Duganella aceris TaxID=2703883 RepID=A0ABX0FBL9_9BURK|nr:tetratricopeptide repeat protein [Duganella aceris]NGZ82735.1 tetratricopeptide repeat protein [Duganella aceris]